MQAVVFDFDYTLFDTHNFKKDLGRCLITLGISEDSFWKSYQRTVERNKNSYDYDVNFQLRLLNKSYEFDEYQAGQLIRLHLSNSYKYLYQETFEVLDNFTKRKNVELILLTLGNKDFQERKVKNSGIAHYFRNIIITPYGKHFTYHLTIPKKGKVYFITDSSQEIIELGKKYPQVKSFLKLGSHKNNRNLPEYVQKISNLKELIKIVN